MFAVVAVASQSAGRAMSAWIRFADFAALFAVAGNRHFFFLAAVASDFDILHFTDVALCGTARHPQRSHWQLQHSSAEEINGLKISKSRKATRRFIINYLVAMSFDEAKSRLADSEVADHGQFGPVRITYP